MVKKMIDLRKLKDISIGSFRISQDYLKKMRRAMPASPVVQFPFVNENGYYSYGKTLSGEMENYVIGLFSGDIPADRIFQWR
jgi:spore photoproduct lyase